MSSYLSLEALRIVTLISLHANTSASCRAVKIEVETGSCEEQGGFHTPSPALSALDVSCLSVNARSLHLQSRYCIIVFLNFNCYCSILAEMCWSMTYPTVVILTYHGFLYK